MLTWQTGKLAVRPQGMRFCLHFLWLVFTAGAVLEDCQTHLATPALHPALRPIWRGAGKMRLTTHPPIISSASTLIFLFATVSLRLTSTAPNWSIVRPACVRSS